MGNSRAAFFFFRVPLSLLFALPPVLVEGCRDPGAKEEEEGREEKGRKDLTRFVLAREQDFLLSFISLRRLSGVR